MKLEFLGQIFEKHLNIKFNENPSSDSRVVAYGQMDGRMDGQMDGQTDGLNVANSRPSKFCESV